MATTTLFSQHSSNPLEVPSSDLRNKTYLNKYRAAKAENDHDSDERSHGGAAPEMQAYHSHLAQLYTERGTEHPSHQYQRREQPAEDLIDLDAEMESDEEREESDAGSVMDADSDDEDDDDDSDAEGEVDDEHSLYLRPREELEEILAEMNDLSEAVAAITPDYKLVDRLGTGTFSSVYKALDLGYHSKWDNTEWHGHHHPASSAFYQSATRPPDSKVFVAIKRIYVTSSPERIRNEIAIMEDCRGTRHVSQLITAFRQEDQVVAIMPYHRNSDFRVCAFVI
jgi:cell division control protein 7